MALAVSTSASTYYVRSDGNDGNNGASNASNGAWKTLGHAFALLHAGDMLNVADGTYNEYGLALSFSGGSKSVRTTVKSINKWGAKMVLDAVNFGLPIAANGVIIDGFEITWAPNPTQDHKGIEIYGNWTTVRNCHVHDIPFSGISGAYCDNVLIENNLVHDNFSKFGTENGSGISIWDPHMMEQNTGGYNVIIRNNIVYHNWATSNVGTSGHPTDGNGIIIDDFRNAQTGGQNYAYKTLVENNLCFSNGRAGISVFSSENVTVRNNTAWHNGWILNQFMNTAQIGVVDGINNEFYNNIAVVDPLFSSKTAAMQCKIDGGGVTRCNNNIMCGGWTQFDTWSSTTTLTSAGNGGNVTSTDVSYPRFVDPTDSPGYDFHLKPTSPVIDVGYNASTASVDLDGKSRPIGGIVDPGCYEYVPATIVGSRFSPAQYGAASLSPRWTAFDLIGREAACHEQGRSTPLLRGTLAAGCYIVRGPIRGRFR